MLDKTLQYDIIDNVKDRLSLIQDIKIKGESRYDL